VVSMLSLARRSAGFLVLCGATVAYGLLGARPCAASVVISEFLASNADGIVDEDGDSSDWIELHNEDSVAVDLDGWCLTDQPDVPRWCFPPLELAPGAYLVVFASGKDRRDPLRELHADFELDAGGEYLALLAPDGSIATEFAPAFPGQRRDVSFGRGELVVGDPLVSGGDPARIFVPSSGALGSSWTGAAANEPFDDSAAAGWAAASLGVGYPLDSGPDLPLPLAYWSFDGTTADLSGNGHGAELRGAAFDAAVPPALAGGMSLRFRGASDYASVPINVSESAYTCAFWFRADSGGRGLFCVVDSDLGGGGHDRHVYLNGSNVASRVWNDETIASSGRNFADGGWHHLAHVVGGGVGAQRIYVDGVVVVQGNKASSDFDWQRRVNIGFSNDAAQPYFAGRIDDLAIWSDALDAAQVAALAAGASPLTGAGLSRFVSTDVASRMRGVNPSIYVRVPFAVALPLASESLRLRTRFDDGYVAWLNGVEIARRNAPALARFDSTSTVDRSLADALRVEDVDLGRLDGVLRNGANVLAIQGLNESATSEEFLLAPELIAVEGVGTRYFENPTAGAPNDSAGLEGFVADTRFSVDRGIFSAPFEVEISTATEGATIRYTIDGSAPTATSGRVYASAILVDQTTILRAAAFRDGLGATNVDTQTYIFPADVLAQPVMLPDIVTHRVYGPLIAPALARIPSISIVTTGAINQSSEVAASVELVLPSGGDGFRVAAGVKKVGGHSLTFPKNNMRLYFRRQYGPGKLHYALYDDGLHGEGAAEEFDQLDLRGGSHDSIFYLGANQQLPSNAQYVRNRWMSDTLHEMGQVSNHGRFVHVYINGTYWGHYQIQERPTRSHVASYLGGNEEDFESINSGRTIGPESPAWAQIATIRGNWNEISRWVDAGSLVDYMLLNFYAGNAWDWTAEHNWMAAGPKFPDRGGYRFFSWDADITLRNLTDNNLGQPGPGSLFRDLLQHAPFRRLLGDRIHRHFYNDGVLTPSGADALFTRRAVEIFPTIVAETARWRWSGIVWTRDDQWQREFERLCGQWFPQRTDIVLEQIRRAGWYPTLPAPEFLVDGARQHGGIVADGARVEIVVPGFESFVDTPLAPEDSALSAWVPRDGSLAGDWRLASYVEGSRGETWSAGAGGVGYENGSGYEPVIGVDVGAEMTTAPGNTSVYVRVPFRIDSAAEIARLGDLVLEMLYDDGFVAYLNGVRIAAANAPDDAAITWSSRATAANEANLGAPAVFDVDVFRGALRVGDNLLAIHGLNFSQGSSDMIVRSALVGRTIEAGVPPGSVLYTLDGREPADGAGVEYQDAFVVREATRIIARANDNGAWSASTEALFEVPGSFPLRVTEVHYHPTDPPPETGRGDDDYEFLELRNVGVAAIDLRGVRVRDAVSFEFDALEAFVLEPGEHIVLVNNLAAFSTVYDVAEIRVAGEYDGRLSNGGEHIVLSGHLGDTILELTYVDTWYPATDGGGHSLVLVDPLGAVEQLSLASSWRESASAGGSPGFADGDEPQGGLQLPGDVSQDGRVDVSDAVRLLFILFAGARMPCDDGPDAAAGNAIVLDTNSDASVDLSDAVSLLAYLFEGGPPPARGTVCRRVAGCAGVCLR